MGPPQENPWLDFSVKVLGWVVKNGHFCHFWRFPNNYWHFLCRKFLSSPAFPCWPEFYFHSTSGGGGDWTFVLIQFHFRNILETFWPAMVQPTSSFFPAAPAASKKAGKNASLYVCYENWKDSNFLGVEGEVWSTPPHWNAHNFLFVQEFLLRNSAIPNHLSKSLLDNETKVRKMSALGTLYLPIFFIYPQFHPR